METKIELNQVSLEAYQKGINDLILSKEDLKKKQAEFQEHNFELIQTIDSLNNELGQVKDKFKELGIEEYIKTGEKQLIGGLGVRIGVALRYDEGNALEWAESHKLCLLLDKKAFEKIAKYQEINFVDRDETVTITFPKEIKFEKDKGNGKCDSCGNVAQTQDYNGKQYCNDCINAEEHGEKANN